MVSVVYSAVGDKITYIPRAASKLGLLFSSYLDKPNMKTCSYIKYYLPFFRHVLLAFPDKNSEFYLKTRRYLPRASSLKV